MNDDLLAVINQARYAQRLCERTARLYRRLQTACVFVSVIGGSAALAALGQWTPTWLPPLGAAMLALAGAIQLSVRPADKAAANEVDVKRYAELQTQMRTMTWEEASNAFAAAQHADAAEVEPLRDVAYNDVLRETGNAAMALPLRIHQRVLAALA